MFLNPLIAKGWHDNALFACHLLLHESAIPGFFSDWNHSQAWDLTCTVDRRVFSTEITFICTCINEEVKCGTSANNKQGKEWLKKSNNDSLVGICRALFITLIEMLSRHSSPGPLASTCSSWGIATVPGFESPAGPSSLGRMPQARDDAIAFVGGQGSRFSVPTL